MNEFKIDFSSIIQLVMHSYLKWKRKRYNPLKQLLLTYPKADWSWLDFLHNPLFTSDMVEKYIDKYENHISDLCERSQISTSFINNHPEYDWNWNLLSYNFYISSQLVKSNLDKSWNWEILSERSIIGLDIIESNLDKPWNWSKIFIANPNCTLEFFTKYKHKEPNLLWYNISAREYITPEFIESHPEYPWDWDQLSRNSNITLKFVQNNIDKPWDWGLLVHQKFFNIEVLRTYKDKVNSWFYISRSIKITTTELRNNIDLPWDWAALSGNQNHKLNISDSDLPWDWTELSFNTCYTSEFIIANKDKQWRWWIIQVRGPLTVELIKVIPEDEKNWASISSNPNININVIKQHPELPWNKSGMAINPNLTLDDVKVFDLCEFSELLASNGFFYDNDIVAKQLKKKDEQIKQSFIINNTGMVLDLAEIVALYCSYM